MKQCEKCKEWLFNCDAKAGRVHRCPPLWLVTCPEYDDEWQEIYESEESSAAEKFAEEYDADSHDMMDGNTIVVSVKPHEDNKHYNLCADNIKTFVCSGKVIPTYYASEIKRD
ncbi:hypothetical protein LCGC14_0378010 [marine sediment metagenome]|uniref:Uncharacterized protein n=1 Tax=marine sediment metagenome TaxID=412755 RepID=A0A0F9WBW2_9ZZZZ